MAATTIKSVVVDSGISVFYRTASPANKPAVLTILLLHGLQKSSHQYRHLIPLLARHYNVVVPDLTGFGFLTVSPKRKYTYTFAALSRTIGIFDYRAPVLLRIALERPTASTAIITQNGDAYIEGLGSAWAPIQKYQETGSAEDRAAQERSITSWCRRCGFQLTLHVIVTADQLELPTTTSPHTSVLQTTMSPTTSNPVPRIESIALPQMPADEWAQNTNGILDPGRARNRHPQEYSGLVSRGTRSARDDERGADGEGLPAAGRCGVSATEAQAGSIGPPHLDSPDLDNLCTLVHTGGPTSLHPVTPLGSRFAENLRVSPAVPPPPTSTMTDTERAGADVAAPSPYGVLAPSHPAEPPAAPAPAHTEAQEEGSPQRKPKLVQRLKEKMHIGHLFKLRSISDDAALHGSAPSVIVGLPSLQSINICLGRHHVTGPTNFGRHCLHANIDRWLPPQRKQRLLRPTSALLAARGVTWRDLSWGANLVRLENEQKYLKIRPSTPLPHIFTLISEVII
ncbi:hypothetical protein DFH09DRAFT_1293826 [Mycena vulgaris]|nr:hypothetical protein DFH09DRAFT_1293826 [Mycena vulgaris]